MNVTTSIASPAAQERRCSTEPVHTDGPEPAHARSARPPPPGRAGRGIRLPVRRPVGRGAAAEELNRSRRRNSKAGRCAAGGPGKRRVRRGGAFRRYDADTAEFKRIWTHSAHRRRGLARLVLAELEALAARRGYRRVYLTTGPRQPEARHLYLTSGYEAQFDLDRDPGLIGSLAFTKDLRGSASPGR